jgi:hypothetical protein
MVGYDFKLKCNDFQPLCVPTYRVPLYAPLRPQGELRHLTPPPQAPTARPTPSRPMVKYASVRLRLCLANIVKTAALGTELCFKGFVNTALESLKCSEAGDIRALTHYVPLGSGPFVAALPTPLTL